MRKKNKRKIELKCLAFKREKNENMFENMMSAYYYDFYFVIMGII